MKKIRLKTIIILKSKINKYIAAFDYIDKTLMALSKTSAGVSLFLL